MPGSRQVTVTDSLELLRPGIEHLQGAGVTVVTVDPGATPDEAAAACAGSPAAIVGVLGMGPAQLDVVAAGGTRLIVRAGIGYDNIDVAAARERGIEVANVPDYCVDEVADHAVLLLLAAWRRLGEIREIGRTTWQVAGLLPPVHRIRGSRLGLIGLGRIGRMVARRASGFGFEVVAHDPWADEASFAEAQVERVELDELLATCDAISLHCPLSPATTHLIDAAAIARMRPGAVLVNTSRGGLVDLDAVDAAVAAGALGAVALDVLDGEPDAPLGHPLLQRPQVLVTPHISWYSLDARVELAVKSAEEAVRLLDGEPVRHPVPRADDEPASP